MGWYGVKDVVFRFINKGIPAERLVDEKESTAREDSHGGLG